REANFPTLENRIKAKEEGKSFRIAQAQSNIKWDFLFIPFYVSFLVILTLVTWKERGYLLRYVFPDNWLDTLRVSFIALLVIAGLSDIAENVTMWRILSNQADSAFWWAIIKFSGIGIVIIFLLLAWLTHPYVRVILMMLNFYLPAILSIILIFLIFGFVSQGQDVLIIMGEQFYFVPLLVLCVFLWAMLVWYASRLVTYFKREKQGLANATVGNDAQSNFLLECYRLIPRYLGWLGFFVMELALLRLPALPTEGTGWESLELLVLLASNILLLVFVPRMKVSQTQNVYLFLLRHLIGLLFVSFLIALLLIGHWVYDLLYYFIAVFLLYASFVQIRFAAIRRKVINAPSQTSEPVPYFPSRSLKLKAGELRFFYAFNIISLVALVLYLCIILFPSFDRVITAGALAFLAFGVITGAIFLLKLANIQHSVNFTFILFVLLLVLSNTSDPYKVRMSPKIGQEQYQSRPDIETYFDHWAAVRDTAFFKQDSIPLYFIMSDGGASRSAYWVVSFLGRIIEDPQKSKHFQDHLFAISGASGGTVGNVTFYTHLRKLKNDGEAAFLSEMKNFVKKDFLTYTLARMLGPDFIGHLFPFYQRDRGTALELMLERKDEFGLFERPFAEYVFDSTDIEDMPILYLTTTRAQDGRPGLLSNIKVDSSIFNDRIDVLDILTYDSLEWNITTGTATIMSSRFPYVSPAANVRNHFFVDGGYFDNSGAGPTVETMKWLDKQWDRLGVKIGVDSLHQKIHYQVIHHTNSPTWPTSQLTPVAPLLNDLAAPLLTLAGSYGQQTNINNSRLKSYLRDRYPGDRWDDHWTSVDLYDPEKVELPYSYSWVTSQWTLDRMDRRMHIVYDQLKDKF
ncbi:MAG: patatin-like phospholipase family protein, partial [Cyclobacteriaceae bacterium]|nr:patatin-like phospholipase family protein [Cyclobacteriaceae bacterium HetDA_MAG_MS6]